MKKERNAEMHTDKRRCKPIKAPKQNKKKEDITHAQNEKFFNLFSMNRITITLGSNAIYKNLRSLRFFRMERKRGRFEAFLQHVASHSIGWPSFCAKLHIFYGVICYRLRLCAKGFRVAIKRFSLHLPVRKKYPSKTTNETGSKAEPCTAQYNTALRCEVTKHY